MSMLRFEAGEMAIFAVAMFPSAFGHQGEQVEVLHRGPFGAGSLVTIRGYTWRIDRDVDYAIGWRDGYIGCVRDWQLRKINPPAEPATLTRREEVEA